LILELRAVLLPNRVTWKPFATPPVVWKTTEEDGNHSVVATTLVSFAFFSSRLGK
jgi:hypothetical protein